MLKTEAAPDLGSCAASATRQQTILQNLACLFCALFGIALILNTQPAGDGTWFWYATFLHGGHLLYSGMHLALQPLFVLETSAWMALFGKGWLVSKIPATLHLLAYCFALLLLVRRTALPDWEKAILLACAFFVSTAFEAYRFDDYHILADCFQLYSLAALLALPEPRTQRSRLLLTAALGILSGLAVTTRLNDGAALFVGVALALLCLAPARRLLLVVEFAAVAALTTRLVVHLTGDSFHDYATYSILHAAGSKGGTGSVLAYPFRLPFNTLYWMRTYESVPLLILALAAAALWTFAVLPVLRKRTRSRLAGAALGAVLMLLCVAGLFHFLRTVTAAYFFIADFTAFGVLAAYALGLWVLARFALSLLRASAWNPREILLLIPLGQLASASMSSGGSHLGLYGPIAVLMLLLAICSPIHWQKQWPRDSLIALSMIPLCCALYFRAERPFSWHTYVEKPLFAGRTWYRHPDYGPMVIDRDLLQMIQPVCSTIQSSSSAHELLSLPLPFANYFCDIPPWQGYVQTFFDTSSPQTIATLISQLQTSPPQWVFYQRQLYTLRLHEIVYNQGKPLEQRYLDQLIEQKISSGQWHVAYTSRYGNTRAWDNQWLLIQTR